MEGLRERQRRQRHAEILAAAGKLFTESGFEETTVEDVAREAMVSAPTVYSYFQSKADLLFALYEADEELIEKRVRAVLEDLPPDPCEAIIAIELAIITQGYDFTQKRVWREIMAATLYGPQERRASYAKLQAVRIDLLQQGIEMLKGRSQLLADLDTEAAARIVHAIGRNAFRRYIGVDDEMEETLVARIRTDIAIAFAGFKA